MRSLGARTLAALLLFDVSAHAQAAASEPTLRVQVVNCPDELASRLPAVVKLEIDVLMRERGPTRAPPDNIGVRCEDDRARIDVTLGAASRASTVDLRALAAEHRARAIALASAELVHSLSRETPSADPPAERSSERPAATAQVPTSSPRPERPDRAELAASEPAPIPSPARRVILVGGLAELLGKPAALLWGARLAMHVPLGRFFVPAISVDGEMGRVQARSSEVTAQTLAAAAALYVGTTIWKLRWDIGAGARFGWMHLAGKPVSGSGLEGQTLNGMWGGPEMRARISYFASPATNARFAQLRSPALALELGAGVVTLPIRGLLDERERVYGVVGPWGSICAEIGVGL
jgi:hypothetical protein